MQAAVRINPADSVAVALRELAAGETIEIDGVAVLTRERIPSGHKVALTDLPAQAPVFKYGLPIGRTKTSVFAGQWVHSHNLRTALEGNTDRPVFRPYVPISKVCACVPTLRFSGFLRRNGTAGSRNELWVLPMVGCVNGIAEAIVRAFLRAEPKPAADDVRVFPHDYGCSQTGEDLKNTRRILRGLALHPNAGGVLLLGLGCENNDMGPFLESLGDFDQSRIRFLIAQQTQDEVAEGVRLLRQLDAELCGDRREELPVSLLRVGLKCGGSDGFSGITANPLLGLFSDAVTALGGSAVMTEVPEMFGAEPLLFHRAADARTLDRMAEMIRLFKRYYIDRGFAVSDNPSPGNKAGGITTLEEKALGCTQKSGSSPVCDVLPYGGAVRTPGLSLLTAPGNDLVSTTALTAAGCQLILFTTGRGTPFGAPVPTLKISSNSALAAKKPRWIDFDAGGLLNGEKQGELLRTLASLVQETLAGRQTRNEQNRCKEIAVWKNDVTL